MKAVIQTGGKQYIVAAGDKIRVEKIEGEPGQEIVLDQVLLVEGDQTKIGTPLVAGAKVSAKIMSQDKADKVIIYKYKRRKGYHKTQGHRQKLTKIEITGVIA